MSFEYRGIQNFKIDSVGLSQSKIGLELIYFNPNNFGAELRNVNCDVLVNHNYLGHFVLDINAHTKAKRVYYSFEYASGHEKYL